MCVLNVTKNILLKDKNIKNSLSMKYDDVRMYVSILNYI